MGNAVRLEILQLISQTEWTVGALANQLGLSQSALSQHLAKLRLHDLVDTRREAQTIYYSGNNPGVKVVLEALVAAFAGVEIPVEAPAPQPSAAAAPAFSLPWQTSARGR